MHAPVLRMKEDREEGRKPGGRKKISGFFKAQSTCVLGRKEGHWFLRLMQSTPVFGTKEGHWFLTPKQPLY